MKKEKGENEKNVRERVSKGMSIALPLLSLAAGALRLVNILTF